MLKIKRITFSSFLIITLTLFINNPANALTYKWWYASLGFSGTSLRGSTNNKVSFTATAIYPEHGLARCENKAGNAHQASINSVHWVVPIVEYTETNPANKGNGHITFEGHISKDRLAILFECPVHTFSIDPDSTVLFDFSVFGERRECKLNKNQNKMCYLADGSINEENWDVPDSVTLYCTLPDEQIARIIDPNNNYDKPEPNDPYFCEETEEVVE